MHDPQMSTSSIAEELYAKALGQEMLKFGRTYSEAALARQVNADALLILDQIQKILNDETLDDPQCFYRIDAIVDAFHHGGLSTHRHDF